MLLRTPVDVLIASVLIVGAAIWLWYAWHGDKSLAAKVYWTFWILAFFGGEVFFASSGATMSEITIAGQPLWLVVIVTIVAPIPFVLHWWDLAKRLVVKVLGGRK